jgi:glycosyltransferase involved in cell wall biosynthesis
MKHLKVIPAIDVSEAVPGGAFGCVRPADPRIVVVLPAFNEAENLERLIPPLCARLQGYASRHEVVVVDDGSSDATAAVAVALGERYPVSLIRLSRNFGKEAALSAGLDHADGDVVIIMDADLQHPVEVVHAFIEEWRAGYDMVYGVRAHRDDETALKRLLTGLFYRLLSRSANVEIAADAGDFRLMDRRVVEALRRLPERSRMMKGLYAWVGFPSMAVAFTVAPRASGRTSFGLRQLFSLAITGFTSFSSAPLRVWMVVGAGISLLAMLYGAAIVVATLIHGSDVPGWPTLAAGLSFLGGVQLFSIGVLGEYVARIFSEVKSRPLYLVSEIHRTHRGRFADF